jgi:hypothetical protein
MIVSELMAFDPHYSFTNDDFWSEYMIDSVNVMNPSPSRDYFVNSKGKQSDVLSKLTSALNKRIIDSNTVNSPETSIASLRIKLMNEIPTQGVNVALQSKIYSTATDTYIKEDAPKNNKVNPKITTNMTTDMDNEKIKNSNLDDATQKNEIINYAVDNAMKSYNYKNKYEECLKEVATHAANETLEDFLDNI